MPTCAGGVWPLAVVAVIFSLESCDFGQRAGDIVHSNRAGGGTEATQGRDASFKMGIFGIHPAIFVRVASKGLTGK
jgi:hypothetical protein